MPSRLQVPVEVPPGTESADDPDLLSIKINQIFLQKGPFRNVTEQSVALGPEIDESESEDDDKSDQNDDETREERLELLAKTRQELFETIRRGTLQCNEALDFISLLLSKHSRAAVSTFSPALKDAVEPGTLEGFYLDNARYAPTIRPKQDLGKGWRTQSFLSATEKLRTASKRLKREADSQSSFWAQVAEVGEDGWKVSRHPGNRRQLGVFFAMPESAPQFRSQGFVTLQQNDESNIQLGKRPNKKRVSVTISRAGKATGKYTPGDSLDQNKSALLRELTEARDCLIDEELFHELGREARLAANQGITTRGEEIEFSVNGEFSVGISLETADDSDQLSSSEDNDLAMFITLALRSLLNHAHHQNFLRRNRPPLPISTRPTHTLEYAMLRPMIATLRHRIAKLHMEKQLEKNIIAPLRKAGINMEWKLKREDQQPSFSGNANDQSFVSVDVIRDIYTITSPVKVFDVRIVTYLGPPLYGVTYEIVDLENDSYSTLEDFLRALVDKVLSIVDRVITLSPHEDGWKWESDVRIKGVYATLDGDTMPFVAVQRSLNGGVLNASIHVGHLDGPFVEDYSWDGSVSEDGDYMEHHTLVDFVNQTVRINSDEILEKHENPPDDFSDSDESDSSGKSD